MGEQAALRVTQLLHLHTLKLTPELPPDITAGASLKSVIVLLASRWPLQPRAYYFNSSTTFVDGIPLPQPLGS